MPNGATKSSDLFENIGETAEEIQGTGNGEDEVLRPVEEIESMCVACEENV